MASKMVITLFQLWLFRAKDDQQCIVEQNREKDSFEAKASTSEAKASTSHNCRTGR
jgi:hypothetical protein